MAKKGNIKVKVTTPQILEKPVETLMYSVDAYCNIIGAQDSIRYVANLKFRGSDKKTSKEWKESFKKAALI